MGRRLRRRRVREPRRLRMGREMPGTVLRGPPITVTCECGAVRKLHYGEAWTCDACGRRWNTSQIPSEQYQRLRRVQLRYRVLPVLLGMLVAGVAIFFSLTGNVFSLFFLLPGALTMWFAVVRPAHRRRYRAAIGELPRWNLRPD